MKLSITSVTFYLVKQLCSGWIVSIKIIGLVVILAFNTAVLSESSAHEQKKRCDEGDSTQCLFLAHRYQLGIDVKPDNIKAHEYTLKACEGGDSYACLSLANGYVAGGSVVKQNDIKANNYFLKANKLDSKAFEVGDSHACFRLGHKYSRGIDKLTKDYFKAKEFFFKACEAGHIEGCATLGMAYAKGLGVKQDKKHAKKLFGDSCDMGFQGGCDQYRILNEEGIK